MKSEKPLAMSERAKENGRALLKGLLESVGSPENRKEYKLSIKWIENTTQPKLLVKANAKNLTNIIADNHSEWQKIDKNSIANKYIDRTRRIISILNKKLYILDDLRFEPKEEKELFFLLKLWSYEDTKQNLDEFEKIWEKSKNNELPDVFFQSSLFVQKLINAIPFPVFYKDSEMKYRGFNDKFKELLGRKKEHIIERPVDAIALAKEAKIYKEKDLELLNNFPDEKNQFYSYTVFDKDSKKKNIIFCKGAFSGLNTDKAAGIIGIMIEESHEILTTQCSKCSYKFDDSQELINLKCPRCSQQNKEK